MSNYYEFKRWFSETGFVFTTALPCYVKATSENEALEIAKSTKQIEGKRFSNFEFNKYSFEQINSEYMKKDMEILVSMD